MSSQNTIPKDSLTNLNRKFENQFADINVLLDKVIERNSKVVDLAQAQGTDKAKNVQIIDPTNTHSTNKTVEGPVQTHSYLTPKQEINYSLGHYSQSPNISGQGLGSGSKSINYPNTPNQGEGFLRTPNKPTNVHSVGSTAISQNEDSYDYSGGKYSSHFAESAKQGRPEFHKTNKPLKAVETSQEVVFESTMEDMKTVVEPSTFHMSNNNLDSPRNRKQSNINEQILTGQNADHSGNLNVSENTDIFGEKSLKFKLSRKQKIDSVTRNLVEENLEQYESDLSYSNKYAPQEVLKSIEASEDGKFFLCDPIKQSPIRKASLDKSQDPIDQIVVLQSPAKDVKPEDKLVGIYQQVSEEYMDGTSYTGEKFLGLRQGKGTYYYHDGYRYEGTWDEDKMSGFGILWVNDDIKWYEGEWKDNTFHGRGIIYNITPEELDTEVNYSDNLNQIGNGWIKYEGRFNNGTKHGFGTLFLTNGDTFTGTFNLDHIDGRGSYAKPEKKMIIAGTWEKNVLKVAF